MLPRIVHPRWTVIKAVTVDSPPRPQRPPASAILVPAPSAVATSARRKPAPPPPRPASARADKALDAALGVMDAAILAAPAPVAVDSGRSLPLAFVFTPKCPRFRPLRFDPDLVKANEQCVHDRDGNGGGWRGDGRKDHYTGRVAQYPCVTMDCPRHWRNYASLLVGRNKLRLFLHPGDHWQFGRLTFCGLIDDRNSIRCVDRFLDIIGASRNLEITGVFHRSPDGDHLHYLSRADRPLTAGEVRAAWARCFPAKDVMEYHGRLAHLQEAYDPLGAFEYCVGLKGKPRLVAPWEGLPLKSPCIVRFRRSKAARA